MMRWVLCFFMPLALMAQEDWQAKYPFLHLDKNKLVFMGDSARFMAFYQKLDTLVFKGKGQVNVVHFGGSHVQAGTLSNRLRENWVHLSPNLRHDRGFFFPFDLAKTNNPRDYKVTYDGFWEGCRCAVPAANCVWGVSGINATTMDTNAAFSIVGLAADSSTYRFSRVRIFYQMHDSSFTVVPTMSQKVVHTAYDSVAHFVEFTLAEPASVLSVRVRPTKPGQRGFTLQGIQYVSSQPGLLYHAIGVNGAATYSYLRCQNFSNQLRSINPDLVIFGIGINDANRPENEFSSLQFEHRYDSLVALIRGVNPNAVFIFMTNNDSFYKQRYSNPNIAKVQQAMQNLSTKYQSAYWDFFEIMGGYNSIVAWERYGLAKKDKIHLTPEGYVLNADLLFEAIKQGYGNYLRNQYEKQN